MADMMFFVSALRLFGLNDHSLTLYCEDEEE
jgi:hypothetical protein